jgi:hypothetical protein
VKQIDAVTVTGEHFAAELLEDPLPKPPEPDYQCRKQDSIAALFRADGDWRRWSRPMPPLDDDFPTRRQSQVVSGS